MAVRGYKVSTCWTGNTVYEKELCGLYLNIFKDSRGYWFRILKNDWDPNYLYNSKGFNTLEEAAREGERKTAMFANAGCDWIIS